MRAEGIIFDIGDTLLYFGDVDKAGLFRQAGLASYQWLKEHGQPVGNSRVYLMGKLLGFKLRMMWSNLTGNDFDSLEAFKQQGLKSGYDLSDEQWEEFNDIWYEPLKEVSRVEDGLSDTLSKLKEKGIKLGVLSNTFVNKCSLEKHLAEVGVLDYFDVRVYSYQFKYRKPDRQIFLYTAEQMGVDPSETLFVGDLVRTDIKGALRAGMRPVLKLNCNNRDQKTGDDVIRIEKLSELAELVD
jgi:HAD superfamily hydrolase (TIGR01662 family)